MTKLHLAMPRLNWKSNGRLFGFGTSPETDWKIILVSAVVLAFIVITLCAYMFIKINKGEIFLVDQSTDTEAKTLDVEVLRETVSYYQSKALEFEHIRNATTTEAVDPSL
jgi:hypothetical protein